MSGQDTIESDLDPNVSATSVSAANPAGTGEGSAAPSAADLSGVDTLAGSANSDAHKAILIAVARKASIAGIREGINLLIDQTRKNASDSQDQIAQFLQSVEPIIEQELAIAASGDLIAASTLDILTGQIKSKTASTALNFTHTEQDAVMQLVFTALKVGMSFLVALV